MNEVREGHPADGSRTPQDGRHGHGAREAVRSAGSPPVPSGGAGKGMSPACLKQGRSKSVSGWCPCPLEAGAKRGSRSALFLLWKRKDTPEAWGKRGGSPCLKQGRSRENSPRRPQRTKEEQRKFAPAKRGAEASNNGRTTGNRPAEAPRKDGAKTLCRERAEGKAWHRSQSEAREMQASNPE